MGQGKRSDSKSDQTAGNGLISTAVLSLPPLPISEPTETDDICEDNRRCASCWDKDGGIGRIYKTTKPKNPPPSMVSLGDYRRRYYACDKCGKGFHIDVEYKYLAAEHRLVMVITR